MHIKANATFKKKMDWGSWLNTCFARSHGVLKIAAAIAKVAHLMQAACSALAWSFSLLSFGRVAFDWET